MKKNYFCLLIAVLLISATVSAQHVSTVNEPKVPAGKENSQQLNMTAKFHQPQQFKSAAVANTTRWYNFGDAMNMYHNLYLGDSSQLYGNYLFPDSTILVDYGTSGYGGTWIHMLGDILDVKSGYFNDVNIFTDPNELFLNATSTYYVDSLDFYFIYNRNITSVVDSMIFEVAVNNTLTTPYFCCATSTGLSVAQNLGTDTVFIKNVPYTYTTNVLNLSGKKRYAFALDDALFADSSANGIHHIAFGTSNLAMIQAGKFPVVAVQFKPGYTWTANNDTLANMNSVRFISYKESPGTNPPTSFGFPQYTKKDFNISYIVPQDVRYNQAGGWNGYFIPSYAYMGGTSSTYAYEHHLLYYRVNLFPVGMEEYNNGESITTQIYPNPVSGVSTFNYKLEKADNVEIVIADVMGRVVKTMPQGFQSMGVHTVEIDGSNLAEGLYTYTVKTTDAASTRKMSVAK